MLLRSTYMRTGGVVVGTVAALTGVTWAGPRPSELPRSTGDVTGWLSRTPVEDSIATLAGLGAELCLLWLGVGALFVALGRLPGVAGAVAGAVAVRVTPRLVRRAVEAALGVTVATASVATGAAPALAAAASTPPAASYGSAVAHDTVPPATPLPGLDRPASPPSGTPLPPKPRPVLTSVRAVSGQAVVVRRGDCLWAIAARHLGAGATDAQIAAAWPRWYAANRAVIGPDPDLLLPGQRLLPPR